MQPSLFVRLNLFRIVFATSALFTAATTDLDSVKRAVVAVCVVRTLFYVALNTHIFIHNFLLVKILWAHI